MAGDRYCQTCGCDLGRCYDPPIECEGCEVAGRYEEVADDLARRVMRLEAGILAALDHMDGEHFDLAVARRILRAAVGREA